MRKPFRSIGTRLSRVVVLAVLAGILVSVSFFLVSEFRQTVRAEQARLGSSAAAFAAAAAPNVRLADQRGVLLVLRGIREMPEIRYAAVVDSRGEILAEIGQAATLESADGAAGQDNLSIFTTDTLAATTDIRDAGEIIGTLTLKSDITSLRGRYLDALRTSLLFGLALMVVTALIVRAQISRIIRPLGELASEFADIGSRSDLTRRLRNDRSDEVGILIDAFNEMFSHIQRRDTLLQDHRDTLEQTVEVRTSQLRVAKDEAERANAAKSEFLATMSHEIRTPMNGMMVMAEMLSAAPLSPRHLRYAEIISRSGRGLLNIINDILDLSKIEAGQLRLEEIPFSLDAIVEDAAALFAERAREKGLAISVFVAPELPRMLIGDPTRISQVVGNLLNNALKFTEQGGVSVEVHRASDARADGSADIRFLVRDTGIGIAGDKVDLIFERFSQADGSITRRFGGTGLGLSISRMLVEAMGGSISVESEVGLGSTFSFCIRLPEMEAVREPVRLEGRRIGVLASSEIVVEGLCKALRARGAEVALDDAPSADAVLVQSGQEHRLAAGGRPIVLLRDFATSPASLPDAIIPAGELALPVGRVEFDAFVDALASRKWDRMTGRSTAAPPVALTDLSSLRVLAVDDTAVNREVLNEALGAFRIQAHLAESGPGAIEMVRKQGYDIIFMDCSMPGMDGFQATAEIRDVEARLHRDPAKIVALTAHVTGPEAARWREAGMDAYVSKPFTIAQLAQVLEDRAPPAGLVASTSAEPDAALEPNPWQSEPLLAPETLGMFRSLSRTQGNALAGKVFGLFDAHTGPALKELRASLADDPSEAAKSAHALKSMCLSAGAGRAAAICGIMEDRLKSGAGVEQAHIDELTSALQDSREAMTAYLMQDAHEQPVAALSA